MVLIQGSSLLSRYKNDGILTLFITLPLSSVKDTSMLEDDVVSD